MLQKYIRIRLVRAAAARNTKIAAESWRKLNLD
jgi:hypothetical protein